MPLLTPRQIVHAQLRAAIERDEDVEIGRAVRALLLLRLAEDGATMSSVDWRALTEAVRNYEAFAPD